MGWVYPCQTWRVLIPFLVDIDDDDSIFSQDFSMYLVIAGMLVVTIITVISLVLCRHSLKAKWAQWRNANPGVATTQKRNDSHISKTFDVGAIQNLLKGNSDMVDINKEIVPQIANIPQNLNREVPRSAFEIKEHLGSGHFGSVRKGEIQCNLACSSKLPVAIKLEL